MPLAALDRETRRDVVKALAEPTGRKVDPYRELTKMRTCIALHLPSESLGELLLRHADSVFMEDAERYVRE